MNKTTKIFTINDITSIDFYLASTRQIENDGISFEHAWSREVSVKEFVVSFKICKIVIDVEIH